MFPVQNGEQLVFKQIVSTCKMKFIPKFNTIFQYCHILKIRELISLETWRARSLTLAQNLLIASGGNPRRRRAVKVKSRGSSQSL